VRLRADCGQARLHCTGLSLRAVSCTCVTASNADDCPAFPYECCILLCGNHSKVGVCTGASEGGLR
jgi:hypothetical protein